MANRFATHHELHRYYEAQFDKDVAEGKYSPVVFQLGILPALLAFTYFMLPHRRFPWVHRARFLFFGAISSTFLYIMIYFRAKKVAMRFGIGLVLAWSILWFGTMMLCYNPQKDFKRMAYGERRKLHSHRARTVEGSDPLDEDRRNTIDKKELENGSASLPADESMDVAPPNPDIEQYHYRWQAYPDDSVSQRFVWICDLLMNFRGLGWNWHISGPPPPPPKAVEELQYYTPAQRERIPDSSTGKDGTHRYLTRRSLMKHTLTAFITGYLQMDLLKILMMKDPYFWGYVDSSPPSYLPAFVRASSVIIRSYRSFFTMYAVLITLSTIFSLSPLFFCILIGPKILGPHAEPWMYPDAYGSYSNVLDKGLAGWWGGWWHQTFRFAFDAPSQLLIKRYSLDPRSLTTKALRLFVAFALSAFVHACGTYTAAGPTQPILGTTFFFLLQPLGIAIEMGARAVLKKLGLDSRSPILVNRILNFIWVQFWLYFTAPFLCDDFALGGIWLFEPIGFSPLRLLGFGTSEDTWWTWGGPSEWFFWHEGTSWWTTGWHM